MDEDPQIFLIFLGFAVLLALSAFFSAAEVAYVSLTPARVRLFREQKSRSAKLVVELKSRPQRFLTTILIGNNLVNIFTAGLATMLATKIFGSAGLAIATGVMTLLILVFGEIVPKTFAQRHAIGFALAAVWPLFILDKILLPITFFAEKFLPKTSEEVTEKEVLATVEISEETGDIQRHEREMIQNIIEFTDTRVEAIMTPRVEISGLEKATTVAAARKFFAEHSHSRIPVFDGSIDKVVGILTLRKLFQFDGDETTPIKNLPLRETIFTPASRLIRGLLMEFRARHTHLAIVIDEHGGTLGLATLEDLLEEIVGEIEDEIDVPEEGIQRVSSKVLDVPGDTSLSEVDDELETHLAAEEFEAKNVAFLVLEKLGRLPAVDARVRHADAELTVEEVEENKIIRVKIERLEKN